MLHKHKSISEAYNVLGLEDGTPLEVVKSTYKQMALKTHPDKNPDNAEATTQFQQLSSAYNVLLKHLDTSLPPAQGPRYSAFGSESEYEDDYNDDDFYFDDDDDEYYCSDEDEQMDFYLFLLQELLRSRSSRFNQQQYFRSHHHMHGYGPPESQQEYAARLRRQREEMEAAAQRRQREEELRKTAQQEQREKERLEAEKRREAKATKKKEEASASRKSNEEKARALQERSQRVRSSVFAAARSGDVKKVQKGVWEDSVDAAGGEVKPDCDAFVEAKPEDPAETLSHIAASRGDAELFEWLDSHGADMEERDSKGQTPFHVALAKGNVPILRYLFEMHSPKDDDSSIYKSPPDTNLLTLALQPREPEVFWMILENGLASEDDMSQCWSCITSNTEEKLEQFTDLLIRYGGFTLSTAETENTEASDAESPTIASKQPTPQMPDSVSPDPNIAEQKHVSQDHPRFNGRGRGRGRGRRYFRGRSSPRAP